VTTLVAERLADGCAVDLDVQSTSTRVASAGDAPCDSPACSAHGTSVARVPLRPPSGDGRAPSDWLVVGRAASRPPFDADDPALVAELARRMALALEHAHAYLRAQDAIAGRERVLAVVAHDLRSPLTAARFDVEMLRAEPEAPLAARDARVLERVERAMRRMDGRIEDLLDLARLNNASLALERRP
jgi:K+-sensing histidine kinase KdpD